MNDFIGIDVACYSHENHLKFPLLSMANIIIIPCISFLIDTNEITPHLRAV